VSFASLVTTPATVSAQPTSVGSGSAHTKGAWAEAFASLAAPIDGLTVRGVNIESGGSTRHSFLLDVGVGAAGSETVVCADIPLMLTTSLSAAEGVSRGEIVLPLALPRGTRVAVRHAANVASTDVLWHMAGTVRAGVLPVGLRRTATYGIDSAATLPTALMCDTNGSGSLTGFGAWVEYVASAPFAVRAVMLTASRNPSANVASHTYAVRVGVGAASSEVPVLEHVYRNNSNTSGAVIIAPLGTTPLLIPQGRRISLAVAANTNNANARQQGFALHLFG
jgi:hypothetical protein